MARTHELKNYMEEIVERGVDEVISFTKACKCDECRCDISAIALNNLTPKYVVTKKGSNYAKMALLQNQFGVDVIAALTSAAEIVKKYPRHE